MAKRSKANKASNNSRKDVRIHTPRGWHALAYTLASNANEYESSTRRGIRYVCEAHVTGIINNHPYAGYPDQRDRETLELMQLLAQENIDVLAYATYPENAYTYAMIVNADEDQHDVIHTLMYQAVNTSLAQIENKRPDWTVYD